MSNHTIFPVIVFLVIFPISVLADGDVYWDYDIPIYDGARNISIEKDKKFCIYSVIYELKIEDTSRLLSLYSEFFQKKGWSNPLKKFSHNDNLPLKWNGINFNWNSHGLPEFVYSSLWDAQDMPVHGVVRVTLTGISDGIFDAKVLIHMSPEIDMSPIYEYQKKISEDPQSIFLLHEAVKGNPFLIESFENKHRPKHIKNKIIKEYYFAVDKILARYKEFYLKHISKKGA